MFGEGGRYRNRRGEYEVLALTPPTMEIRYLDGQTAVVNIDMQERIIRNMQAEADTPPPPPPTSRGRSTTPRARRRSTPAPKRADSHLASPEQLEVGLEYRRRDILASLGNGTDGPILTPTRLPWVVLVSSTPDDGVDFHDHWDHVGYFYFLGEVQPGPVQFTRGNLAVRDHVINNEQLHLFEAGGDGALRYSGEMVYVDHRTLPVADPAHAAGVRLVFRLRPVGGVKGRDRLD